MPPPPPPPSASAHAPATSANGPSPPPPPPLPCISLQELLLSGLEQASVATSVPRVVIQKGFKAFFEERIEAFAEGAVLIALHPARDRNVTQGLLQVCPPRAFGGGGGRPGGLSRAPYRSSSPMDCHTGDGGGDWVFGARHGTRRSTRRGMAVCKGRRGGGGGGRCWCSDGGWAVTEGAPHVRCDGQGRLDGRGCAVQCGRWCRGAQPLGRRGGTGGGVRGAIGAEGVRWVPPHPLQPPPPPPGRPSLPCFSS